MQCLKPHEQLVHTNLSLFYMKAGDKKTAEHHGLQARIASWRTPVEQGGTANPVDPDLQMARPEMPPPPPRPAKMPEMPWKKNKPIGSATALPAATPSTPPTAASNSSSKNHE
jgi:hypothetical protein